MEKLRKVLRWFRPPGWVSFFLVNGAAAGLFWVFLMGNEEHPMAYGVYVLSFYALCVVSVKLPEAVRRAKGLVLSNPLARRYFTDRSFKARLKLYSSTVINITYGIFKLAIGIVYHSAWFGSVAVYYMVLSVLRYLLVSAHRRTDALEGEQKRLRQWKSYHLCGWLLLVLNTTITGMVFQMIWRNRGYSYPGFIIYVFAAYTFYRLTMSIIRAVKNRHNHSPVFAAAGAMDLCVAVMSIFALQTAMFSSFGGEMSADDRFLMNSLTGGGVSLLVVCIAVFMIIRSHRIIHNTDAIGM